MTVVGCAAAVTVEVIVDGSGLSPSFPALPMMSPRIPAPMTPPAMSKPRLSLGGGGPQLLPFQYDRPAVPLGSGYQPGGGVGASVFPIASRLLLHFDLEFDGAVRGRLAHAAGMLSNFEEVSHAGD
jgi:hypothetical protein